MLRDPKNPVHSIASCPRSIALRTHFNGNHFDRKFSESHIFLFLLLHPHTTTKTRKITCSEDVIIELQHLDEGAVEEELGVGDRICPIFPHPEKYFNIIKEYFHTLNKMFLHHEQICPHHESMKILEINVHDNLSVDLRF